MLLAQWLELILGVSIEVRGEVPSGACIIAAKHQSAWETIGLLGILSDPCFVLKKELSYIPIFGWYIARNRQISVDRASGMVALKALLRQAQKAVVEDRQIVVFPQGTRVEVGASKPYQPGIAALYHQLNVPVFPVALNSGLVWGRNKFVKHKGKIIVQFLPAVRQGLSKNEFLEELSGEIELVTDKLVDEGRQSH
ncbi:MAG: lysophospholipid acyltransferase family protein [Pseudomonadota bacterium]|nr:lysophospholipid acyltransferase family protein [Pseudomonadota bacterium]